MAVYRCEWCGRFYSSQLPEDSACPNHIPEHNARLRASIERFNRRLAEAPSAANVVAEDLPGKPLSSKDFEVGMKEGESHE